ncbi:hypothetical protein FOA52_014979 [Chlamydomonas sp. UWO 241]|nr:hypothetical protein FOA52_014979 [Chlamydomonas sp. UWO 241]
MGNQLGTPSGGSLNPTRRLAPSDSLFLLEAAKRGDDAVLSMFLSKNPACAFAHSLEDGSTGWHYSAQEGHLHVLELLASATRESAVSNTFDPLAKSANHVNARGQTPLMLASGGGHLPCARFLLANGAGAVAWDAQGLGTLHYAALGGSAGVVSSVLRKAGLWGPSGRPQPPPQCDTALLRLVNGGDAFGRTPLHYAAWAGDAEAVAMLLHAGASVSAHTLQDCFEAGLPCNGGTTPLHLAAMKGHAPVAAAIMAAHVSAATAARVRATTSTSAATSPLPSRLSPRPGAAAAASAQLPPQLSPRDPRTVTDAYSNTPAMIASSHLGDVALLQLLDPSTPIACVDDLTPFDCGNAHARREVLALMAPPGGDGDGGGGSGARADAGARAGPGNGDAGAGYETDGSSCASSECSVNYHGADGAPAATSDGSGSDARDDGAGCAHGRRRRKRARRRAGAGSSIGSTDTHILGEYYGFGTARAAGTAAAAAAMAKGGDARAGVSGRFMAEQGRFEGGHVRELKEALARAALDDEAAAHTRGGAPRPPPGRLTTERDKPDTRPPMLARSPSITLSPDAPASAPHDHAHPHALPHGPGGGAGARATDRELAAAPAAAGTSSARRTSDPGSPPVAPVPGRRISHDNGIGGSSAAAGRAQHSGEHHRGGGGGGGADDGSARQSHLGDVDECGFEGGRGDAHAVVVPDCFLCPLTCQLLRNPVVAADGVTYEEGAIARHFASGSTASPLTGKQMPGGVVVVYPNKALRQAVAFWAAANHVEELGLLS